MNKVKLFANSILTVFLVGVCVVGASCDDDSSSSSSSTCLHETTCTNYDDNQHWVVCVNCGTTVDNGGPHNLGKVEYYDLVQSGTTTRHYYRKCVFLGCGYSKEIKTETISTSSSSPSTSSQEGQTTSSAPSEHTHTFKETWSCNDSYHWHGCEGCNARDAFNEHNFSDWVIDSYMDDDGHAGSQHRTCQTCEFKQEKIVYDYNPESRDNNLSDPISLKSKAVKKENTDGAVLVSGDYKKFAFETLTKSGISVEGISYCFAARVNYYFLNPPIESVGVAYSLFNTKKTEDFSDFSLKDDNDCSYDINSFSGHRCPSNYFGSGYPSRTDSEASEKSAKWKEFTLFRCFETDSGDFYLNPFSSRYQNNDGKLTFTCPCDDDYPQGIKQVDFNSFGDNYLTHFSINLYFLALVKIDGVIKPVTLAFGLQDPKETISRNCAELTYDYLKGLVKDQYGKDYFNAGGILRIDVIQFSNEFELTDIVKQGLPNTYDNFYLVCFQYIYCSFKSDYIGLINSRTKEISIAPKLDDQLPSIFEHGLVVVTGEYKMIEDEEPQYVPNNKDALYWPFIKLHTLECFDLNQSETVFYYPLESLADSNYPYFYYFDPTNHAILSSDMEIVEFDLSELARLGFSNDSVIPYSYLLDEQNEGHKYITVGDDSTEYNPSLFRKSPLNLEPILTDSNAIQTIKEYEYYVISTVNPDKPLLKENVRSVGDSIRAHFYSPTVRICGDQEVELTWRDFVPKSHYAYKELDSLDKAGNLLYRFSKSRNNWTQPGPLTISKADVDNINDDGFGSQTKQFGFSYKEKDSVDGYTGLNVDGPFIDLRIDVAPYYKRLLVSNGFSFEYQVWAPANSKVILSYKTDGKTKEVLGSNTSQEPGLVTINTGNLSTIDDFADLEINISFVTDVEELVYTDKVKISEFLSELEKADTNDTNGYFYQSLRGYLNSMNDYFKGGSGSPVNNSEAAIDYIESLESSNPTLSRHLDGNNPDLKEQLYISEVCMFTDNQCVFGFRVVNNTDKDAKLYTNGKSYDVPAGKTTEIITNLSFTYADFYDSKQIILTCTALNYQATYSMNGWEYLYLGLNQILEQLKTAEEGDKNELYEQLNLLMALYDFARAAETYNMRNAFNGAN